MNCRSYATMSGELYSLIEDDLWPSGKPAEGARPVVAHTIGRWSTQASREREILTRLARRMPVFVLEAPVYADDVALGRLDLSMPMPNVWRAVPRLPSELARDEEEALDRTRHFAQQMIGAGAPHAHTFANPVQWFFTPMPAPRMLGAFGELAIVYDCLDERTWLRLSPRGAAERERLLLARADIVFASDAAALRVRARAHRNVHIASPSLELPDGTVAAIGTRDDRWSRLVALMEGEVERIVADRPLRVTTPRATPSTLIPGFRVERSSGESGAGPLPPAAG